MFFTPPWGMLKYTENENIRLHKAVTYEVSMIKSSCLQKTMAEQEVPAQAQDWFVEH